MQCLLIRGIRKPTRKLREVINIHDVPSFLAESHRAPSAFTASLGKKKEVIEMKVAWSKNPSNFCPVHDHRKRGDMFNGVPWSFGQILKNFHS
jgi:hypothetical protein